MAVSMGTSPEFLKARLQGRFASGFWGARLETLSQSTTPDLLAQNLQAMGLKADTRKAFYQCIALREESQLFSLARQTDSATGAWLRMLAGRTWFDNVKVLLHSRCQENVGTRFGQICLSEAGGCHFPLEELGMAADDKVFLQQLPLMEGISSNLLPEILQQLRVTGDDMLADCRLDQFYYNRLLSLAEACPSGVREPARELLSLRMDILNFTMLLRNSRTYQFSPLQMERFWFPGGRLLPRQKLHFLVSLPESEIIRNVPLMLRRFLNMETPDLSQLERSLWNILFHRALTLFRGEEPLAAVASYPFLLHFETLNLGRIYECVHFAISPEKIPGMMIRREHSGETVA